MRTLHFAPNSISLAALIVLEELGTPYGLRRVDLASMRGRSSTQRALAAERGTATTA